MSRDSKFKTILFRNRPEHISSQYVWKRLVRSILIPPSTHKEWVKNSKGEWDRVKSEGKEVTTNTEVQLLKAA